MSGGRRHTARTVGDAQRRAAKLPLLEPCPSCGKMRFHSRKAAKARGRHLAPGESISVYRCGEYFHWGHTPRLIREGAQDRRTFGARA